MQVWAKFADGHVSKKCKTIPPGLYPLVKMNRFTPSARKASPFIFLIRLSKNNAANRPITISDPCCEKGHHWLSFHFFPPQL
jgi:hypothetical protein